MVLKSLGPDKAVPTEPIDIEALSEKYAEERDRRKRADGADQYEELEDASRARLASLAEDPFVDHEAMNAEPPALEDGQEVKVVLLGAGFSGLLFAARLIEAGLKPDDIRLIEAAGGFGGTWYWNRYPGVMCDTEASVYCPLLEETGFMPSHKYSYGEELRGHTERIARHYGITDKALFRTCIHTAEWDDETRRWRFTMTTNRGPGREPRSIRTSSQFFCFGSGVLNHPKAPRIPGLDDFAGAMFHTARWDYAATGGSPADQTLTGLRGKRVGIMGTGATAVQAVPRLAQFAAQLFVFQRTPSSIGVRGQHAIDEAQWRAQIAVHPGWQAERRTNFELLSQGEPADARHQTDGWTTLLPFAAFVGRSDAPDFGSGGDDEVPRRVEAHVDRFLRLDVPFQEAIRARVDRVVRDRRTAEALKPWYNTWCKRPCFHDEYLDTFNLPHVHLVDTSGTKGIRKACAEGLVLGSGDDEEEGEVVQLDVLILATGFRGFGSAQNPDPGARANMKIIGSGGRSMADKWAKEGAGTLHGMTSEGFPNLFMSGVTQASASPNFTGCLDVQARHVAYIISESLRRVDDDQRDKLAIEPTKAAQEAWVTECLKYDLWASAAMVCTPGYFNNEGEALNAVPKEEQMRRRRGAPYFRGLPAYRKILEEWRAEGELRGIVLST